MEKKFIADLNGHELDYWVGVANGFSERELVIGNAPGTTDLYVVVYGVNIPGTSNHCGPRGHGAQTWNPSTNWTQGGPIIEDEYIDLKYIQDDQSAYIHAICGTCNGYGETHLTAAMRCFISSRFGNYVPDKRG